jgi:putative transposase
LGPTQKRHVTAVHELTQKACCSDEVDRDVFNSLAQLREITESWLREYNEERPHDGLGPVPPLTFLPSPQRPAESTYELCA